jgi:hypothetical protein
LWYSLTGHRGNVTSMNAGKEQPRVPASAASPHQSRSKVVIT